MKNKRLSIKFGSGALSIIGVILVVLKLAGVINWGWVAVLAPFYIPVLILLMWFVILLIFVIIFGS